MTALLLALVLAQAGDDGTGTSATPGQPDGPIFSSPSLASYAFFEFAPVNGAGLPSATPLCDTLTAGEKSGNWWCLQGNGTMASGSVRTLTAVGSPTSQSSRTCPNGPDCTALTSQRTGSGNRFATSGTSTNQVSAITACWWGVFDSLAATAVILAHNDGAGGFTLSADVNTSGASTWTVRNTTPATVATGAITAVTLGAVHVLCGTYSTSDGIVRSYIDGVAGAASGALVPATLNAVSSPWVVAGTSAGFPAVGLNLGAFVTDTQLAPARIAAIARAVLADAPTGAKGEAVTFTRTTPRFCESSDGTGSVLPNGRWCIAQNGGNEWVSNDNRILRSALLDNAAWAATATVTADQFLAPDGTLRLEQLNDVSAAASQGVSQVVATTSATLHNVACWVRSGTATSATISLTGTGSSTGDCTASTTSLTTAGQWLSCSSPAAYAGTLTSVSVAIVVGNGIGVTGTIGAGHCQFYTGVTDTRRPPWVETVAVAVNRAFDNPVFSGSAFLGATASGGLCAAYTGDCDATLGRGVTVTQPGGTLMEWDAAYPSAGNAAAQWLAGATSSFISTLGRDAASRRWLARVGAAGSQTTICQDGTCQSGGSRGADSVANTSSNIYVGNYSSAGFSCNGTVRNLQVDPTPLRCTP